MSNQPKEVQVFKELLAQVLQSEREMECNEKELDMVTTGESPIEHTELTDSGDLEQITHR